MMSEAAEALLAGLCAEPSKRVRLGTVRRIFHERCRDESEHPDARGLLADVLEQLATAGRVRLPTRNGKGWDRTGARWLPGWLDVDKPVVQPKANSTVMWVPRLAWAETTRGRTRDNLMAINHWLSRADPLPLSIPLKERSLEIFGDEKRLNHLRKGHLLFDGQLTLEDLACEVAPAPMPCEWGPAPRAGKAILIVENLDTWTSFCRWNQRAGRYAAVAYGGGGSAQALQFDEAWIIELVEKTSASSVTYFGDIDPHGLLIGAGLSRRCEQRGLGSVLPENKLYDWLLTHGRRNHLVQAANLDPCRPWMGEALLARCEAVFAAGQRVPQEGLGLTVLSTWSS